VKIWFRPWIGGQRWTVAIVPDADPRLKTEDGSELHGACLASECLIILSDELKSDALIAYCLHELEHAVFDVSGAANELSEHCDTAEEYEELEERLVRYRNPVLLGLLRELGVCFPSIP